MSFRDDHEAVAERLETLQNELEGARRDLATSQVRLEELAKEIARLRETHGKPEVLTEGPRGGEREVPRAPEGTLFGKKRSPVLIGAGIVVGIAMTLGALLVLVRAPTMRSASPEAPPPDPRGVPLAKSPASKTLETTPTEKASPPPEKRIANAAWPVKITASSGKVPPSGTSCTVAAAIQESGRVNPDVTALVVTCGATKLYDSDEPVTGMREYSGRVGEDFGLEDGSMVYDLAYKDTGTGDKPQIAIDSYNKEAKIWRYEPHPFKVELAIGRASAPVKTSPLGFAFQRGARVTAASGRAQPVMDAACSVRVAPQGYLCAVRVACGKTRLYGGEPFSAFGQCPPAFATVTDDEPSPKDSDPRVKLDFLAGAGVIADEPASAAPWKVELEVEKVDGGT